MILLFLFMRDPKPQLLNLNIFYFGHCLYLNIYLEELYVKKEINAKISNNTFCKGSRYKIHGGGGPLFLG